MSILEKLRELAHVRSVLGDTIEDGAHFGRVMALEIEVFDLWSELVGPIDWKRRRFGNANIWIQHSDRRVRHRHIRRDLERHFLASDPAADVRSTSVLRTLFDGYATAQVETEDALEADLFNTLLNTHRIPYNDDGIAVVTNAIRDTLATHHYDHIQVTAVPTDDRHLEVSYIARAPGAVDTVQITGTVDI